jgi:hypothetical protein
MAGDGWIAEWRLVQRFPKCHFTTMDHIFIGLLCISALLGFAMGWGRLSQKIGCALLCAAPVFLFAMIRLEPMLTGERQGSTAALAIPFGTLWIGVAAAAGVLLGVIGKMLTKR